MSEQGFDILKYAQALVELKDIVNVATGLKAQISSVTASQCHTRTRLSRYSPHTCPHCGTSEQVGTHGAHGWQLIDFGWVDFTHCESPLLDDGTADAIPF